MWRTAACLALASMLGCSKQGQTEAPKNSSLHPDLKCARPTIPAGKAPPLGFEVWCQQGLPDGTWLREGPSLAWHPNEQLKAKGSYMADRRTDYWEFWYATGELEKKGSYVNGVEEGEWFAYHPNGHPKSEGAMVDGKAHGPWVYWEEDARSRIEGSWVFGERDGVWLDYDADDRPFRERMFRGGRLISMREVRSDDGMTGAPPRQ